VGRDLGTGLSMLCLFRIMEFGATVYIMKVISCGSEGVVCEDCCLLETYAVQCRGHKRLVVIRGMLPIRLGSLLGEYKRF